MSKTCTIPGCNKPRLARGWCVTHYTRWRERGSVHYKPWRRENGTGGINTGGHIRIMVRGKHRYEHQLIAERALGRKLRKPELVHHADCNPANNSPTNLVICPDDAYHRLLHKRTRALDACGNANWLKCRFCKKYGAPSDVVTDQSGNHHLACRRKYMKTYLRAYYLKNRRRKA